MTFIAHTNTLRHCSLKIPAINEDDDYDYDDDDDDAEDDDDDDDDDDVAPPTVVGGTHNSPIANATIILKSGLVRYTGYVCIARGC